MRLICRLLGHKVDIIYNYKRHENELYCSRCGNKL